MSTSKNWPWPIWFFVLCNSAIGNTERLVTEPKSINNNYKESYGFSNQYPVAQSRDAAVESSYGAAPSTPVVGNDGQPMMFHYQLQPMAMASSGGGGGSYGPSAMGYDEEDGGGGGGGFSIPSELGLLGLGGLKGLKPLKALKAAKALGVLAPLLLPLLPLVLLLLAPLLLLLLPLLLPLLLLPLLLLLLPLLLLLFLPIPVITIPGRQISARSGLDYALSDECTHTIMCQISRAAQIYGLNPNSITKLIDKSFKTSKNWIEIIQNPTCKAYKCNWLNSD